MGFIFHVQFLFRFAASQGTEAVPAGMSAQQLTDAAAVNSAQRPSWQTSEGGVIDDVVLNCIYLCLWR